MAPNWCENELEVVAETEEELRAFLEAVKGQHGPLDFNRLVPMPESLHMESGSDGEMAYAAWHGRDETGGVSQLFSHDLSPGYWLSMPWMRERLEKAGIEAKPDEPLTREHLQQFLLKTNPASRQLGDQYAENIRQHGHATWYGWAVEHWGTKWNVDREGDGVELNLAPEDHPTSATLGFETAWSPPEPVVRAMATKWPRLRFALQYWESGMGFTGVLELQGGRVLAEHSGDYSGPRGG